MSKLSRLERETVIVYNQAEDEAVMTTADLVMIRQMDKKAEQDSSIVRKQVSSEVWEYRLPKKYVRVKLPRKMTEEQRKEYSERAKMNLKRRG